MWVDRCPPWEMDDRSVHFKTLEAVDGVGHCQVGLARTAQSRIRSRSHSVDERDVGAQDGDLVRFEAMNSPMAVDCLECFLHRPFLIRNRDEHDVRSIDAKRLHLVVEHDSHDASAICRVFRQLTVVSRAAPSNGAVQPST